MAGRKKLILTEMEIIEIYEYLKQLKFLRVKEEKCLLMLSQNGFRNHDAEQIKLIKDVRNQMNETLKNFVLLNEISQKKIRQKLENQLIELSQKTDRQSFFDLLNALNDLRIGRDKIRQVKTSTASTGSKSSTSEKKDEKRKRDAKKYFIGDLTLKFIESISENLNDDQVLDAFITIIENEKIGRSFRQYSMTQNKNIEYINQQISQTQKMKEMIHAAKLDSRNAFKK